MSDWIRARRCEGGACAEVARDGRDVLLRSSLAPDVVVRLTREEFEAFRLGVLAGDFKEIA